MGIHSFIPDELAMGNLTGCGICVSHSILPVCWLLKLRALFLGLVHSSRFPGSLLHHGRAGCAGGIRGWNAARRCVSRTCTCWHTLCTRTDFLGIMRRLAGRTHSLGGEQALMVGFILSQIPWCGIFVPDAPLDEHSFPMDNHHDLHTWSTTHTHCPVTGPPAQARDWHVVAPREHERRDCARQVCQLLRGRCGRPTR